MKQELEQLPTCLTTSSMVRNPFLVVAFVGCIQGKATKIEIACGSFSG